MKRLFIPGLILLAFATLSCLKTKVAEEQSRISGSHDNIVITADFLPEHPDTTVTVRISANRSWYASLNAEGASLDKRDHLNLAGATEETELHLRFLPNHSRTELVGTLDIWMEGRNALSIPIRQSGAVYHLDATAETTEVECVAGTVVVHVICNTQWQARIDAGTTTADVRLSADGGTDSADLELIFGNNYDAQHEKYATLVLSAEGCEDKVLSFTQKKAIPFLELAEDIRTSLPATTQSGTLKFRTNCSWRLAVKEGATLADILFSQTEGEPASGDIVIDFSFTNPGDDPHIVNAFTAVLSLDGDVLAPVEVTFSQRSTLLLNFDQYPEVPYGLRTVKGEKYTISITTSLPATYVIEVDNCLYRNKSDSYGLQIPQAGYFGIPGIEGMKISSIITEFKYHSSFRKLRLYACSPTNTKVYYTGVLANYTISEPWTHIFTIGQVTDPEVKGGDGAEEIPAGQGCTMYCGSNNNNLVGKFEIIYEPVE